MWSFVKAASWIHPCCLAHDVFFDYEHLNKDLDEELDECPPPRDLRCRFCCGRASCCPQNDWERSVDLKGMAGCNFYILRTASINACYYRRIIMLKLLFHDWYACIIYLFLVSVSVSVSVSVLLLLLLWLLLLLLLLLVVVVVVVAAVLLVVAAAVVVVIMCSKCMGRHYMTIQVRCVCCWNEDIVW